MKQMKYFGGYFPRRMFAFLLPLFLFGCAPLAARSLSSPHAPPPQKSASPLVDWAATASVGNQTKLTDSAFGGTIKVYLDQEYLAASGLTCKKIRAQKRSSFSEEVAVCRSEKGKWFLAPRIWGHFAGGDGN
ncbi:MAG: hypothetical protein JXK94_03575 [Deltaproteobacteria bacterium]|nr:hypothetical protein [Deltaproteobacteria bacterium]